jgi:hypothetical protein
MIVTPSASQATNFIILTQSNRNVAWSTNTNAQVGIYNIRIIGTISATTTWSNNFEFTLTVTGSCVGSTEIN